MWRLPRRSTVSVWPFAAVVVAVVLAVASSVPAAAGPAPRASRIGAVDFYAVGPIPPVVGLTPEVLAADDLAGQVASSAGAQVTVIPRATVRQAESAMGWRGSDVLRFARLRELARAIDADILLLGWIDRLELDRGGTGGNQGHGFPMLTGFASVTVQVFDARQGRIVSQVARSAYETGIVSSRVAERLIQRVVEGTVPSVLSAIGGG
jgi:hypothetical protein